MVVAALPAGRPGAAGAAAAAEGRRRGVLSVAALLLLPVASLVVGALAYGTGDLVSPIGESLPFWSAVGRVMLGALYVTVQLSWVAGLALLLSVSTDAPLGAVGGAVMASIVSQIIDQIEDWGHPGLPPDPLRRCLVGAAGDRCRLVGHDLRRVLRGLLRHRVPGARGVAVPHQGHHQLTAVPGRPAWPGARRVAQTMTTPPSITTAWPVM